MYNAESTIERCINSIINQKFSAEVEIIIVNDGSSDNGRSIVENFIESNQHIKIFLLNKANGGASSARNEGLDFAKGSYILFLDSDDIFVENSIDNISKAILAEKFDIACFGYEFFDDSNKSLLKFSYDKVINIKDYKEDFFKHSTVKNVIWNKIYLREFLVDNNIKFRSNFEPNEDSLFVFEILLKTSKIIFLNKILYNHISDNKQSYTNKFHNFHYTNALSLLEYYEIIIARELTDAYYKAYEIFSTRILCRLIFVSSFSTPNKSDFYQNINTIYISRIWKKLLVSKKLTLKYKLIIRVFNNRNIVWFLMKMSKMVNYKIQ